MPRTPCAAPRPGCSYERMLRETRRAAAGEGLSAERVKEQEHAAAAAVARTNFRGSISSVFAPYLQ